MQRTYSRRAQRRRSGVQSLTNDRHEHEDLPHSDPSPPRKRQKVFVEIVSPRRKKPYLKEHTQSHSPVPSSSTSPAQKLTANDSKPAAERLPVGLSGFPKTPEKSFSRDLFFATPSHPSHLNSPPTRGNIVKRMLGRSRTESSLEATPSGKSSPVTSLNVKLTRRASSHTLPTTFPENEASADNSTLSSPKPLPTRNTRTYAGMSRSFLVALPAPDTPSKIVEDDTEPHESYADLRARWGIDMSEDEPQPYQDEQPVVPTPLRRHLSERSQPSLPAGMMNDLKSITELRSKGESRRFLDEVGYLFEGLDDSSAISLRRASAFEVVSKLCDLDFNRRAKTSDFYIRTWDKFRVARAGTNDKILDATIAFFALLAARDPRILLEIAQQQELIPTLVEILNSFDHRKDVLTAVLAGSSDNELKSLGILRTDLTALKSLANLVSKESHSCPVDQPSARFLVSSSLSTLPPHLLADHYLPTLLSNLRTELNLLEPRVTAYESGLPLLPSVNVDTSDTPSLFHIEACLRLLDSYLLGQWSSVNPAGANGESLNGLSHIDGFPSELIWLCIVSSNILTESKGKADIARKCLCGAMRVLTLLSHDDPWWCSSALEVPYALPFVGVTVMRSQTKWAESRNTEPQSTLIEVFDLLCLALGLVMNWATLSPKVAVLSRTTSINPMCPGSRLCVRACRCPSQKAILECFTALHVQYSEDGQGDPPECAFLRGYTAILLGLLIKDDRSNQTIVVSGLPGISPSDKIKSLITHCHAFLDLYNDTMPVLSSDSGSPRATPEAVSREAAGRHRATWDKRGEEIARSVIASLEALYAT